MSSASATNTRAHQRAKGQFFTTGNPFGLRPFRRWFDAIPGVGAEVLLEPFAGANHLVRLMRSAGYANAWSCFDLHPPASGQAEGQAVQKRNTLSRFPSGFRVAVTNPPYLARNSARRHGLPYPKTAFNDVYKHALSQALVKCEYVAAIVPESFITSELFHDRLHSVVSLVRPMFEDTEHPVCLALFSPLGQSPIDDFMLYSDNDRLGGYKALSGFLAPLTKGAIAWKFNDPKGEVGLRGVDDARTSSIAFVPGSDIPSSEIKHSSRLITRISGVPRGVDPQALIVQANALLARYRTQTHDAMLTSFKGLREDGKYRRRLDFAVARNLLDHAVASLAAREGM